MATPSGRRSSDPVPAPSANGKAPVGHRAGLAALSLGAALASIFWQSLQAIGSWYVGRELAHNSDTYGFFGVVIVLLTWIYVGAQLFLLAAEINVVRRYRLWPRSIVQPPLTDADKEVFERLAHMSVRRPEAELSVAFTPEADRDPLRSGVDSTDAKADNE